MLDRLEFLFGEALTALRRNGMMTISAISTAAIALAIFGGLGYTYLSLEAYLESLQSEFVLKISVKPSGSHPKVRAQMAEDLRRIDGVAKVVFMPRDVEWRKQISKGALGELAKDIPNPLPDQFLITLSDLKKADAVKRAISTHPQFDSKDPIRDASDERRFVSSLIDFVRLVGLFLSFLTLFTAGTLIFNTVHLTVVARRDEIRTMRLVGAGHGTIRGPFLLEGAAQGFAGGIIAGLLLWGLAVYLSSRAGDWLGLAKTGELNYPALRITGALAILGAALGMLSAALSVRKYLGALR